MRTTLNLNAELLAEAKLQAARSHRSLGAIVDDALRVAFSRSGDTHRPQRIRLPTDGGSGLQPGVDLEDRDQLATILEAD